MGRFKGLRPSPSMMVAFVALFVAGAGTATAAKLITGKQIENSSITSKDLRNSSITSSDVKNGSLLRKDFKSAQLPRGPQGLPGADGRAGRDGFGEVVYRSGVVENVASGDYFFPCPAGLVPVGGDAYAFDDKNTPYPVDDAISPGSRSPTTSTRDNSAVPNAWGATVTIGAGVDVDLIIEAICANSSRTSISGAPTKSGGAKPAKSRG